MVKSENVKIFAGTSNVALATKIAERYGLPLGEAEVVRFKDGEVFVKIDETVRGRDVFVVQSTSEPVNENLMELLIFIDALKRASAKVSLSSFLTMDMQDKIENLVLENQLLLN